MPRLPTVAKELEMLEVASPAAWLRWLASNHTSSRGVWLRMAKKGAEKTLSYAEALDVALSWGWIDSQKRALDASAWLQRFTRRTASSPWSKINRAKAEALIAAGKMQAAGLAEVQRAKQDGRWERAYDGARSATVPADLAGALARNARANAFFQTLDSANRFAILYRVQSAKKPETRAARIERFVAMCAQHETLHPQRPAKTAAPKPAKKRPSAAHPAPPTRKTTRAP
jgi:uncharacterized protein YdeI (YjbR/CyaY-like superfamily)